MGKFEAMFTGGSGLMVIEHKLKVAIRKRKKTVIHKRIKLPEAKVFKPR